MTNSCRGINRRIYGMIVESGGCTSRELDRAVGCYNSRTSLVKMVHDGIVRHVDKKYVAVRPELTYEVAMRLAGYRMEGSA